MAISPSRIASASMVAVLLLGGTAVAFLPAALASYEVHKFCNAIPLGTPVAEVEARAARVEYRFWRATGGHAIVEHPRSLGRAYCDMAFDAGGKLSSKNLDN